MRKKRKVKKDPRGLAASRGTTRDGAQGQNSHEKRRSRSGGKGSPPEGDTPMVISRKVTLAVGREPTFYIGGNNGVALVEGTLSGLGWKRTTDRSNEHFKIKWVECKTQINYNAFKEGEQLVNHMPNCNLLTNKMGLLDTLQTYERFNSSQKRREMRLKMNDFIPETYRIDEPTEREQFLQAFQYSDIWICKPTGMNQGKGIYLVRDLEDFKVTLLQRDERLAQSHISRRHNMGRIIQKYIKYPMLLEGRKFDIRAYMLIASSKPYLVLYHKGYVRLSLMDYDIREDSLTAHLTNQYIQKKDPSYQEEKESTAWSMDKFNDYINERIAPEKGLERDWVYHTLKTRMKQIMMYCYNAVRKRLHCKIGYFDLYGLDFMIDEEMKIYLIEVNVNPSLAVNCEALKECIPAVVRETLYVTLECFEKIRRGQPLLPLHSLQTFEILHNGCPKSGTGSGRTSDGSSVTSPVRSPVRHGTGNNSPIRRQTMAAHPVGQGQTAQSQSSQGQTIQGPQGQTSQGTNGQPKQATLGQNSRGQIEEGEPKGLSIRQGQGFSTSQGQVQSESSKTRVIKTGMNTPLKPSPPSNPLGLRGALCVSKLDSSEVALVKSVSRKKRLKLKMTHGKRVGEAAGRMNSLQEEEEEDQETETETEPSSSTSSDLVPDLVSKLKAVSDLDNPKVSKESVPVPENRPGTAIPPLASNVLVLPKVTMASAESLLANNRTLNTIPERGS